ncbi:MAG: GNAT family N-acetyltransferase [Ignavibacteriales bacterium]|nr:GNAT family N-acetyltransferase [Ignavibacteriales bacterium]
MTRIQEYKKNNYLISTNKGKLDLFTIHRFLTNSYWSKGITIDKVKNSISNSLCFGVYDGKKQIGFARVVTDFTLFGYIADVFIVEEYRGKGLSKWLMDSILEYPGIKEMRAVLLATKDAHGLYARFGFKPLEEPQRYMIRRNQHFLSLGSK